jgi:3-phenylpropionate/trans-cinnamate dioxygenase ferredoxin reductase subunit
MSNATVVIVGSGAAGATAAVTLRDGGHQGPVILVGREPEPPYERPLLSKAYLRGEVGREELWLRPAEAYAAKGIDFRPATDVTAIDVAERAVALSGGARLRFDRLLLATGSRPRRPQIPGIDLDGVLFLRSVADADRLRTAVERAQRVLVVGMGFIGAEVAASLRALGRDVTAVDRSGLPLSRALGPEVAGALAEIHAERGVRIVGGTSIASFEGRRRRLERAIATDGRELACDLAVVGLGAEPNVEIARDAGLAVDDGVVTDARFRTTVDGIFAAGDVARVEHPVARERIRVEHWQNAISQGTAVARLLLGEDEPYDAIPWFWSDQYEHEVNFAGFAGQSGEAVLRGRTDDRRFLAFYLADGRLRAVAGLNRPREVRQAMKLIRAGVAVDPARLADEATDLSTLG